MAAGWLEHGLKPQGSAGIELEPCGQQTEGVSGQQRSLETWRVRVDRWDTHRGFRAGFVANT